MEDTLETHVGSRSNPDESKYVDIYLPIPMLQVFVLTIKKKHDFCLPSIFYLMSRETLRTHEIYNVLFPIYQHWVNPRGYHKSSSRTSSLNLGTYNIYNKPF